MEFETKADVVKKNFYGQYKIGQKIKFISGETKGTGTVTNKTLHGIVVQPDKPLALYPEYRTFISFTDMYCGHATCSDDKNYETFDWDFGLPPKAEKPSYSSSKSSVGYTGSDEVEYIEDEEEDGDEYTEFYEYQDDGDIVDIDNY